MISQEAGQFLDHYFDRTGAGESLAAKRGISPQKIEDLHQEHLIIRAEQQRLEGLRAERNQISGKMKDKGFRQSPDGLAATARSQEIGKIVEVSEPNYENTRKEFEGRMLSLPNPPDERVPQGRDANYNPVVRIVGPQRNFSFEPKPHDSILNDLGLLVDGLKLTGQAKFPILIGEAAALEDALRAMFMQQHRFDGRIEVNPPHMVNRQALNATGQLPKFLNELYHIHPGGVPEDLFLIPTAEVPLTNLLADSTLNEGDLPLRVFGYSRCFRVETGSSGAGSQGLKRVHDFGKVEMVDFVKPDTSWASLETMVKSAETILGKLELDYRVIILCTGDLPAGSAFTYDIETRVPDSGWREISSCTNCLNYQARRGQIRFKPNDGSSAKHVHTLNGSAFPTGRLVAAVLEQYQQRDGSVAIPDELRRFTNFDVIQPRSFKMRKVF